MSNRKLLLLGAGGFIGTKLSAFLQANEPGVTLVGWSGEHDISDPKIVEQVVAERPDIIVIAAGKSFVPDSWNTPLEFYRVNTTGTTNIAEAARLCKAKIVFLSTFVYGAPYRLPIRENNAVRPFNPYASSKFLAEQLLKDYSRHFGVETNVLRVFNVYGQGQREDFLIPMLIRQYQDGKEIRVKDLRPKRDYVHVDDLVAAVAAATHHFEGFQVYNVASGSSYSVEEVIQAIFEAGGSVLPVSSEEAVRPNEVNDTIADISKIREKLNWQPSVSFKDGIREMMD